MLVALLDPNQIGVGSASGAHRLADLNSADTNRHWRCAGVDQNGSVPAGEDVWLSGVSSNIRHLHDSVPAEAPRLQDLLQELPSARKT